MKLLLTEAINERYVLEFAYDGKKRQVEPFILGLDKDSGKLVLRAFCIDNIDVSETPWFLFEVDAMTDIVVSPLTAEDFREHYKPIDYQMVRILCNL